MTPQDTRTPAQKLLGELITHLAFYGAWPHAVSAAMRAKEVLGGDAGQA